MRHFSGRSSARLGLKNSAKSRSPKSRRSSLNPKKGISIMHVNSETVRIPFQVPPMKILRQEHDLP